MNSKREISLFFRPRFTTMEFEKSLTRCVMKHKIFTMFYDDGKAGFPTWATGCIVIPENNKKIQVVWNSQGYAWVQRQRSRKFDLVRPVDIEAELAAPAYTALTLFMFLIILIILIP